MAKDFKKKNHQTQGQADEFQLLEGRPSNPDRPIFTAEQRRILGQVCTLILSWRPEHRMSVEQAAPVSIGGMALNSVIPVEMEA